jgi:phenylalanyl-tRNA synthetase beta chain
VVADVLGTPDVRIENAEQPGLHPTRSGRLVLGDLPVGALGEVDPGVLESHDIGERVAYLEVDLDLLLARSHGDRTYRPFSLYPSSDIDLAFEVADDIPASALEDEIRRSAGDLLWRVRLFDVYRGPGVADGRRSLAYALRLQAPDRTLTDAEVADVRDRVIGAVQSSLPATLRG